MADSIQNSKDETNTIFDSSDEKYEDEQLESKTKDDCILLEEQIDVTNFRIRNKLSKMLATLRSSEENNDILLDNKRLRKYTNTVDLTKAVNINFKLYKLPIRQTIVQKASEYESLKNRGSSATRIALSIIITTKQEIHHPKTIKVNNSGLSEALTFNSLKKFWVYQLMLAYIVEHENKNTIIEYCVSDLEQERKENRRKTKRRKIIQSPGETESLMYYQRQIFGVQVKNSECRQRWPISDKGRGFLVKPFEGEENEYESLVTFLTNSREPLTSGSLEIELSSFQRKQEGIFAHISYSDRPKFRVRMNEVTSSMFEAAMTGVSVDSNETEYITIHNDDCRMFLLFPVYKGGAMHRHEEKLNNKGYSRNDYFYIPYSCVYF